MGNDISGDDFIARQLSVPGNLNLLGFVTLILRHGQNPRPGALTSMLGNGTSDLAGATLQARRRCFIAALISTVQLFKLQLVIMTSVSLPLKETPTATVDVSQTPFSACQKGMPSFRHFLCFDG